MRRTSCPRVGFPCWPTTSSGGAGSEKFPATFLSARKPWAAAVAEVARYFLSELSLSRPARWSAVRYCWSSCCSCYRWRNASVPDDFANLRGTWWLERCCIDCCGCRPSNWTPRRYWSSTNGSATSFLRRRSAWPPGRSDSRRPPWRTMESRRSWE